MTDLISLEDLDRSLGRIAKRTLANDHLSLSVQALVGTQPSCGSKKPKNHILSPYPILQADVDLYRDIIPDLHCESDKEPRILNWRRWRNSFKIKDRSERNLLNLMVFCYYGPEELVLPLKFSITETVGRNRDLWYIPFILLDQDILGKPNKNRFLYFLQITELWSQGEFFGNIVTQNNLRRALNSLVPEFDIEENVPVNRPIRRKGYKDKGTLRVGGDPNAQILCSLEINESFQEKKTFNDTLDLIAGFYF